MSLYPAPDNPVLSPKDLVGDPEYFLPQTFDPAAQSEGIVWKGVTPYPQGQVPLTGLAKGVSQFARGASLGLFGDPQAPETIPQMIAEGAGMILPGIALSSVTGPAVGAAAPFLRTFPIAKHAIAEGLAGAITGAAHAGFTGGDATTEALVGGATGAAAGLGWGMWAKRARGNSAPEQIKEAVESHALREGPPGPPGLGTGTQGQPLARTYPQAPYGQASARVLSNEPIPGEAPIPQPGMPGVGPRALQEGPTMLALPEARPVPIPGPEAPRFPNPAEQMHLPDLGTTQLQLPMDVIPSGRMNRYATPTKFKGTFETPELAASESSVIAQAAAKEGARTIRVTTTIQPRGGAPLGGAIRVYEGQADGSARLVSEKLINMGAVRAAQLGAMPMRRVIPDYFEVVYNPNLKSDMLIPVNKEVEKGLRIALGVEPHQHSFPMAPEQLTYLNSIEGRTIRNKMDLNARHLTLDDVMKMDEQTAMAVLVDPVEAPPAMAGGIIQPTDEAIRARELLANLEITDVEMSNHLASLRGLRGKDRFNATLAWLQSKCGGPI